MLSTATLLTLLVVLQTASGIWFIDGFFGTPNFKCRNWGEGLLDFDSHKSAEQCAEKCHRDSRCKLFVFSTALDISYAYCSFFSKCDKMTPAHMDYAYFKYVPVSNSPYQVLKNVQCGPLPESVIPYKLYLPDGADETVKVNRTFAQCRSLCDQYGNECVSATFVYDDCFLMKSCPRGYFIKDAKTLVKKHLLNRKRFEFSNEYTHSYHLADTSFMPADYLNNRKVWTYYATIGSRIWLHVADKQLRSQLYFIGHRNQLEGTSEFLHGMVFTNPEHCMHVCSTQLDCHYVAYWKRLYSKCAGFREGLQFSPAPPFTEDQIFELYASEPLQQIAD